MENYTVYMHVSPNKKRYIGITGRNPISRWNDGKNYNTNSYFTNAIIKYGWDNFEHIILFTGLSRKEARRKEVELIAKYDTMNKDFGYNLTLGGGGCKGYKQTNEAKERIAQAMSTREISEKTKRKTAESVSKLHDREFYVNIRKLRGESPKGKDAHRYGICGKLHTRSKPVKQIDILTGDVIEVFESVHLAALHFNSDSKGVGHISDVCNRKRRIAYGFIWRYLDDESDTSLPPKKKVKTNAVYQINKNGNVVNKFSSVKDAVIENKYSLNSIANINKCCNGKRETACGYRWQYAQ